MHDFLAASYWVETGAFAAVKKHEWTARTAYAACLTQDASDVFKEALQASDGLPVAAEILNNAAPMKLKVVAQALHAYFSRLGRTVILSEPGSAIFTATLSSDFVRGASTRMLDRLVEEYSKARDVVADTLVTYCLIELKVRRQKLDHVTYHALKAGYPREDFIMQVPGLGRVQISEMNPRTGKVSGLAMARSVIGSKVKQR